MIGFVSLDSSFTLHASAMRKIIFAVLAGWGPVAAFCQTSESPLQVQAAVQFTTTPVLTVANNDTSFYNSFVVAPSLRLFHQKGFKVSYSPYFATQGSQPGVYMHMVTAGYEQYDGATINAELAFTHFFFSESNNVPYTPLNNEVYAYLSYKKLWLAPLLSSSIGFGKDREGVMQSGVNMAAGLTHNFEIKENKTFSGIELAPALLVNGSRNEFYSFLTTSRYITHNKTNALMVKHPNRGRGGSGSTGGTTSTTTTTTSALSSAFSLQNLELNLYSSFQAHHFEIVPTGSLFFPFEHTAPVTGYWQLKLGYDF